MGNSRPPCHCYGEQKSCKGTLRKNRCFHKCIVKRGGGLEGMGEWRDSFLGENYLPLYFQKTHKPTIALCNGDILCARLSVTVLKQQG